MTRVEFSQRPIYGSERTLSNQEYSSRTMSMYQSVVDKLFAGVAPRKATTLGLEDSLGRAWAIDIAPKRSGLYVRRYIGQSNTMGFKTDPKRINGQTPEDKYYVWFWKSMKTKRLGIVDLEWILQESETVLRELLASAKAQNKS
jgi:hypothetical protein